MFDIQITSDMFRESLKIVLHSQMVAHLRRCMRLHLRMVPLDVVVEAKERLRAGVIDVVLG